MDNFLQYFVVLLLTVVCWGCSAPQEAQELITVMISADNTESHVKITSSSTVQKALTTTQISLGEMDRVEPPLSTVLTEESWVRVIRVKEEFYVEQVVIPFMHQELRNEALPEGESRLSQSGSNGIEEITRRRVFEDDIEVSDTLVKSVVLKDAVPEVVMIGSRSTFTPANIPGRIVYLSAGNAWVIETTTDNRRCVVCTGNLDGRIFSLSKDGNFLLFTRFSSDENIINSLWVASLKRHPAQLIDLGVENIVHFAEFNPASSIVAYSTVEWRETTPGWKANNDLYELEINVNGFVGSPQFVMGFNAGGVYGWWGMEYSWAPDGLRFLYSRPDGIGIIDDRNGTQTSILNIAPYQTGRNWAWVPGAAWSPNGNVVYAVNHISFENTSTSVPQEFDLIAIPLTGGIPVVLVKNAGMFAYPEPSPVIQNKKIIDNDAGNFLAQSEYSVAFLKAIFPDQSETSKYRLYIIDRDGSNQKDLFPEEGEVGLDPQHVVWSPVSLGTSGDYTIAFIYNGNIWTIDVGTGVAQQITGDGLTSRIDWR